MVREIANASPLYHPSVMWEQLNALNTEQVERLGLSHFKRSVNQNFFNWLPTNLGDNQMRRVLQLWMRRPTIAPFRSRMEVPQLFEGFARQRALETWRTRVLYRLFVAMLWDQAMREDVLGLLGRVEEPEVGDPLRIHHRGRLITQISLTRCARPIGYSRICRPVRHTVLSSLSLAPATDDSAS